MEDKPLVSIVTPTYNYGKFIEDTMLSVKNQDYPNIEHIIVDGGSTDNTLEILRKYEGTYNMRWISEPDGGQSNAINKGFEMARGEIVAELDSDDVYFSRDVISYVVEQFKKFPDADIIYGNAVAIDRDNNIFRVGVMFNCSYNRLLRGYIISQPATFFRKEVIQKNHFREDLEFAMDLEFWLRLGKNYKFKQVKKILAGNRVHKEKKRISSQKAAVKEDKDVRIEYGQKFNLKYSLFRYLFDFPYITITERFFGIIHILRIQKKNDDLDLAFNGKCKNKWDLVFSQVFPNYKLK